MLLVYKGFEKDFLNNNLNTSITPNVKLSDKINVDQNQKEVAKNVIAKFMAQIEELQKCDKWITYEEFSVCYLNLIDLSEMYNVKINVIENNKYYNIYPIEFYDTNYLDKIIKYQNDDYAEIDSIKSIYSYIYFIDNKYYAQYRNFEYDFKDKLSISKFYNNKTLTLHSESNVDYIFEIKNNAETYLEQLNECVNHHRIGIVIDVDNSVTREMYQGLICFLLKNKYEVFKYINSDKQSELHKAYLDIAQNIIHIPNFQDFHMLDMYKNPYINNELCKVSQEEIINEIVTQIENSKSKKINNYYRDIFVTAPTGAGKSIMFQIPAIYAARKFNSLTIIISPLVELMNDQVYNLEKRGYYRARRFNSDINAFDKQDILEEINNGDVDLLYISPEALLSYHIDSLIGSRDISAVIIDEAHIVSTWGMGFRPDYWYLGGYIESLRKHRYKNGIIDKNAKIYHFPVCTFTATSVFGGIDDGYNEIAESLYLHDPIKFIGKVKRDDIKFDVNINREELNTTATQLKKADDLKNKIIKWQANKEKSLVYFPYNSIALKAFYAQDEFSTLSKIDMTKVGIYTGQVEKAMKQNSAIKYKTGELTTMFATKAFGMGIDIKDIKNVYHYAEAGNLNDYVQEVGRVARDKNLEGLASIDYYNKDANYSKILFGMSAIKQEHVNKCIRVLYNTYKRTQKRNNLITPQAFESVFPDSNDLETSVKTALLNIEKDFNAKYKIPVIITRPRSMFSTAYAVIDATAEEDILSSEYGPYFKKVATGRKNVREKNYQVTDLGDVFSVNLKGLWENMYSSLSFAKFKYYFYSERNKLFSNCDKFIMPRIKIVIQLLDENGSFLNIMDKLLANINSVSEVIAKFQMQQGEFTMQQFKKELNITFKDNSIAENIANSYFKLIQPAKGTNLFKSFYTKKLVGDVMKYRIVSSTYRQNAESLIYKSSLLKELNSLNTNKVEKFKTSDKGSVSNMSKILNLLSMFNLIQYDMYGGENPEIFVRINDPEKIKAIAEKSINYKNFLVEKAAEKHKRDIKIFEKFIYDLNSNEERWNYIEDYFLGNDVLK